MKKLTIILTLALVLAVCSLPLAEAAIPHLISYQGRLTNAAGVPITGSRSISFRIYDASSGGSLLWQESHPSITVTDGVFEVLLGSATALSLPFDSQYYLATQVGSDAEMTPRQQLASSGYAYKAKQAEESDTLDGFHASATPEANKILALDSNAKLPVSTIFKTYDSGWFPVNTNSTYTKTHNLGTTTVMAQAYLGYANGSNMTIYPSAVIRDQGGYGACLRGITTTECTLQTGNQNAGIQGQFGIPSRAQGQLYARIMLLAW